MLTSLPAVKIGGLSPAANDEDEAGSSQSLP
jgi:hypothetical protein